MLALWVVTAQRRYLRGAAGVGECLRWICLFRSLAQPRRSAPPVAPVDHRLPRRWTALFVRCRALSFAVVLLPAITTITGRPVWCSRQRSLTTSLLAVAIAVLRRLSSPVGVPIRDKLARHEQGPSRGMSCKCCWPFIARRMLAATLASRGWAEMIQAWTRPDPTCRRRRRRRRRARLLFLSSGRSVCENGPRSWTREAALVLFTNPTTIEAIIHGP